MCARRFLILVFILILLAVAGAFAVFQFGQDALIRVATPKGHYQAPPPDSGPDYQADASWLARGGRPGDPSEWRPDDWPPPTLAPRQAALFYIHPTTYLDRDRWNAPIDSNGDSGFRARIFTQSQSSAFNGVAEVWAPRYRQAAYGAFLLDSADARGALDLAFTDVEAAFAQFLRDSAGRPIILAAHSQGALHLARLLRRRAADSALHQRIVAAYVVGWPISLTADIPAMGLPACNAADQSGCILSWMSFGDPANPELVLEPYEKSAGFAGGKRRREDMLCVNPLTGTRNGAAPPAANRGTLVPTADLTSATLEPGRVGARCDNGLLIIAGDVPALGPFVLPGNNYHVYDYALFWGGIRADAERRFAAWRR